LISVILPVYNGQTYVLDSIDCILKQTVEDFELIIINDGSNDRSKEIILSKKDNRIIYIENKTNQGLIKTLNKGLYYAKGQYIARMDADDLCCQKRFEKQLYYFEENEHIAILGTTQYIIGRERLLLQTPSWKENRVRLLLEPVVGHSSVMLKKATLVEKKLYYDKEALYAEDYKLWVDASLSGLKIENLNEALCGYRYHKNQVSQQNYRKQQITANSIRLGYAGVFFQHIIKDIQLLYISFVLLNPRGCNDSDLCTIKNMATKMISENNHHLYFDKQLFNNFIEYRIATFENFFN